MIIISIPTYFYFVENYCGPKYEMKNLLLKHNNQNKIKILSYLMVLY